MRGFISRFGLISLLVIATVSVPTPGDVAVAQQGEALPTLAPMLAQVGPAVVNVSVSTKPHPDSDALSRDPFFESFRGATGDSRSDAGSGVIVDAGRGHVLTNRHIIDNAQEIVVTLKDGRRLRAALMGSDPASDIALLKIEAADLVALPFANSDELAIGDYVLAIGNPFGLGESITPGIIGGLASPSVNIAGHQRLIQTSATTNAGNSGGALINLRGQLVGVNIVAIAPGGGDKASGFAIPANTARAAMEKLVALNSARRGRLGIRTQDVSPDLAEALDLDVTSGAIVVELIKGSEADRVGIRSGDVIEAVDGETVYGSADLESKIELFKGGDVVVLTVARNGRGVPITTRIDAVKGAGNEPTSLIPSSSQSRGAHAITGGGNGPTSLLPSASGLQVARAGRGGGSGPRSLTPFASRSPVVGAVLRDRPANGGVVVAAIEQGSSAWQDGLRQADVIATVNRIRVRDAAMLEAELESAGPTAVLEVRRGSTKVVVVLRR